MPEPGREDEHTIRERAYYIWEQAGRPEGQAEEHWKQAISSNPSIQYGHSDPLMDDEEKLLAGRETVNMTALLTKDVPGG